MKFKLNEHQRSEAFYVLITLVMALSMLTVKFYLDSEDYRKHNLTLILDLAQGFDCKTLEDKFQPSQYKAVQELYDGFTKIFEDKGCHIK